eukprot:5250527-Pleurochrysis_carterae.AAC.2
MHAPSRLRCRRARLPQRARLGLAQRRHVDAAQLDALGAILSARSRQVQRPADSQQRERAHRCVCVRIVLRL